MNSCFRFVEEACARNTGTIVRLWHKNIKADLTPAELQDYEVRAQVRK